MDNTVTSTLDLTEYQTQDLDMAAFLKTRGWPYIGTSPAQQSRVAFHFGTPGWDSIERAQVDFTANTPLPSKSLLYNYAYLKMMAFKGR